MSALSVLPKDYLDQSISFSEYRALIEKRLADGRSTGPDTLPESYTKYSQLNLRRMSRVQKTYRKPEELIQQIRSINRPMDWLIITEGWCGDAASSIPVIEAIAAESESVKTQYILRDQHVELIDQFLTNGGRSIPKLIAMDKESGNVLFEWGPRPGPAQELFYQTKEEGMPFSEASILIQKWYNKDKGQTIANEILSLLKEQ